MTDGSASRGRVDRPAGPALALALAVLLAGCTGTLVEFTASPATIPDAALEPQGYVHTNTTAVPITYRVGGAGVSRDVTFRTWVSGYTRTTPENETAVLLLYSSPNVELAGRSVNPLSQLSNRELVRFGIDRVTDLRGFADVENVSDLSEVGVRNVTVLGVPTQLVSYAGVAEVDGQRVAVVASVAVVEHGDDVVVAVGIHEETLDETATHAALVERAVHDG